MDPREHVRVLRTATEEELGKRVNLIRKVTDGRTNLERKADGASNQNINGEVALEGSDISASQNTVSDDLFSFWFLCILFKLYHVQLPIVFT